MCLEIAWRFAAVENRLPLIVGKVLSLLALVFLAAPAALALAVVVRSLWSGPARAWLGVDRPARRAALARTAALTLGSALAAAVGGCIAAQGTRDGTSLHVAAFYALAPLAGLLFGGQHRLAAALRPLGALLGALAVAEGTPLGGVHLEWPALTVFLLAAVLAGLWDRALPPHGSESTPADSPSSASSPEGCPRRTEIA